MNYLQKIMELGFATGMGKGNEAMKRLFPQQEENEIEERIGFAIEDGRLSEEKAEMLLENEDMAEAWLEKHDRDFDTY